MSEQALFNSMQKKKKIARKKKHSDEIYEEVPDTESSDEELDLTKECHPIANYMDDRAEMINQMFSVIKGKKLRAMLPPVLMNMDIEQLKLKCLDQLLGMSEKRIQCILEGEVLDTSSESDVPSEDSDSSKRSSDSEKSVGNSYQGSQTSSKRKKIKRKADADSIDKSNKISKKDPTAVAPDEGKTLLEILELEMRARAIRALLEKGNDTQPSETAKPYQEEPVVNDVVVDLTEGDDDEFPKLVKTEPVTTEQEQTFEDKVEKTQAKSKKEKEIKKQKLIAENEIRNRLIKKKTYRTRKHHMENYEHEDKIEDNQLLITPKEEPGSQENAEIVIEDPEEGEVSTEEECEVAVKVKEEKPDSPQPELEPEVEKVMDGERITAMDDGNFVSNKNVEFEEGHDDDIEVLEKESTEKPVVEIDVSNEDKEKSEKELHERIEEEESGTNLNLADPDDEHATSWRDRWLKKDKVQKVVKSSRICGKVMKRIANKKKETQSSPTIKEAEIPVESSSMVEGSVTEYELLVKKGEVADEDTQDKSQDSVPKDSQDR